MKNCACAALAGTVLLAVALPVECQQPAPADGISAAEAQAIAQESYLYGYPLVTMYVMQSIATNAVHPQGNGRAPLNQFGHRLRHPTAKSRDVTAPNVNMVYSSAWLDLTNEPLIVHLPDTNRRYYVMEMLDAWTNVFGAAGSRTTGTAAQDVAITGPGWSGTLPAQIAHVYRSPTQMAWIINRIQTNGVAEYPIVNALQRQLSITPLSMYGQQYSPPDGFADIEVDGKTSPRTQVSRLSAEPYFHILSRMLVTNPPAAADSDVIARMALVGIVPGSGFSFKPVGTDEIDIAIPIERGAQAALVQIMSAAENVGRNVNGWRINTDCGQFGTNYIERAAVAFTGHGCSLPEDAFYADTRVDNRGRPLTGTNKYVIHFDKDQVPLTRAFWSVTMYDRDYSLTQNSIDRFAVSEWTGLEKNSDGSIDIFVQHDSPNAVKRANWLPAPAENFILCLRVYWPDQLITSGRWHPPAVRATP